MARCEVCGNQYKKSFEIKMDGKIHSFDSFECAIHLLAPKCQHCDCKIIGHGVEVDEVFFCCAHCANHVSGHNVVRDHGMGNAVL